MKRIISIVLCAVMLCSTMSLGVFADGYWKGEDNLQITQSVRNMDTFKLGDADGDGTVDAKDSLLIANKVLDNNTEISIDGADIDADGKVTAKDRFYLKACFAGSANISDYDNGQRVRRFSIAGAEISDFAIVLPEGTTYNDNIYFAYEILLKYIEKTTGVKLQKVYGDYDGKAIRFHNVPLESELGRELGDDGYRYLVKDGNLEIYGATRGNMYAAYEIVEDYLGIFFCHILYSISDRIGVSDIPEGFERQFVTPSKYRVCLHTFGSSPNAANYSLPRHQNSVIKAINPESYYGYYIGSLKLNAHSFYYYQAMANGTMPPEGTLNPDGSVMTLAERYYQKFLNGGGDKATDAKTAQPCASSNDTFEMLYEGLLETVAMMEADGRFLNFAKDRHMVSFSINDNSDYCTCSVCRAKAEGRGVKVSGDHDTVAANLKESYCGYYEIGETQRNRTNVTFKKESDSGLYMSMINRAAEKITEIYPEIQVYSILYDGTIPETVRPRSNMVLCYCTTIGACAKCHFGETENCKPKRTECHSLAEDEQNILAWGQICRETGADLYTWYYPENYTFYLFDLPKFFDIYYDYKWMNEAGISGYLYEGTQSAGPEYTLCALNAYLGSEMMWNPEMSYDEYIGLMKKYLRANYSLGYEHIYNYIVYLNEASEQPDTNCGCYYYRAFDMYSITYIDAHYEEMRNEILAAIDERDVKNGDNYKTCLENLLMSCELLGLSASYDRMYTNGDSNSRKTYEERYMWLYNYIKDNNLKITDPTNAGTFSLPASPSFDSSPMLQIYLANYRY